MTGLVNSAGTSNKRQVMKRRFTQLITVASGTGAPTSSVTPSLLNIPDGARILKFRATNMSSRAILVTIPNLSILTTTAGTSEAPIGGFSRQAMAPLSRFPGITVDVPDTIARPLDAADSTNILFQVSAPDIPNQSATFNITYTAEFVTNIYS